MTIPDYCDKDIAPPGFYAVLKSQRMTYWKPGMDKDTNICAFCDWRPECNRWNIDYLKDYKYRCMHDSRPDHCSVIFINAENYKDVWKNGSQVLEYFCSDTCADRRQFGLEG